MTNLVIQFTNLAFVAVLETAPTPAGPWREARISQSPCAQAHTFTVPTTGPAAFFRGKFLDNGIVPTPATVTAQRTAAASVYVTASMQFTCEDTQAGPTEFWRSANGGPFELIRTGIRPTFVDLDLPHGIYTYKARIVGGLFSEMQPTVIVP